MVLSMSQLETVMHSESKVIPLQNDHPLVVSRTFQTMLSHDSPLLIYPALLKLIMTFSALDCLLLDGVAVPVLPFGSIF
jgi:hypothetical protein